MRKNFLHKLKIGNEKVSFLKHQLKYTELIKYAFLVIMAGSLFMTFSACEEEDDEEPEVSSVFIDQVNIPNIPFVNENGDEWDPINQKPEVYFLIASDTTNIPPSDSLIWIDKSAANYSDVSPGDLPLNWTLANSYKVEDWTQSFYVLVFDKDQVGDDDFMGLTGPYKINNIIDNEPASTEKTTGELKTKIYWSYEK